MTTTITSTKKQKNALLRYISILDWLPKYNRKWLQSQPLCYQYLYPSDY